MKNEPQSQPTSFELKYNNRFIVEFPEKFDINKWVIKNINKPKYTNSEWENIKIEFYDPIRPSTSQALFNIVNFIELHKDKKKLFDIYIKSLDPTGCVIEKWVISVEKVLTINFGDLEYNNDELQTPYIIIKPINCILQY